MLYKQRRFWLAAVCAVCFGLSACTAVESDQNESSDAAATPVANEPDPTDGAELDQDVDLLFVTDQKDGDSWVASDGKEYRLGLINTPERNEQCGKEATAFTSQFLSAGFVADAYTTDTYGRSVAEVFDKSGDSLNVALASSGLGNDQYLEEFRHENPDLGRRLDRALASAATPDCRKAAAPVPLASKPSKAPAATSKCMAGYSPCLPIVADLNCSDIGHPVTVTGSDPYRLDRDHDGTGCD